MTTSEDNTTTERWVYLGAYPGRTFKTLASFRRPNGDAVSFKMSARMKAFAPGYLYEAVIEIDTDGGVLLSGTPTWTGDKAEDYDDVRMAARDRDMKADQKRMQDRARTHDPDLEAVLETVREYAARFKTPGSKQALAVLLERAVWRS